jgi:ribosomal protein S18 acetylase RimI-like enzyme
MPVRRAKPSDARGIVEVRVASWKVAYRGLLPGTLLDSLSVESREVNGRTRGIAEGVIQTLVYEEGAQVIGFVSFGASQDEDVGQKRVGEIYALYLLPAVWRKGRGTALMDKAIERLQLEGYTEVTLWVLHNNEQAKRFYEALDFEVDGVEKMVQRQDGVTLHEVRYRRSL